MWWGPLFFYFFIYFAKFNESDGLRDKLMLSHPNKTIKTQTYNVLN